MRRVGLVYMYLPLWVVKMDDLKQRNACIAWEYVLGGQDNGTESDMEWGTPLIYSSNQFQHEIYRRQTNNVRTYKTKQCLVWFNLMLSQRTNIYMHKCMWNSDVNHIYAYINACETLMWFISFTHHPI